MLDFLEMNEQEEKVFSAENIVFNGTGGTDVCGEWNWSGSYEMSMSSTFYPVDYNYYATISRRHSRKGRSTIGWHVKMYLNMFYGNSHDIQVLDVKVKTLKSARDAIFSKMMELKEDKTGTTEMIEKWKEKQARPVFALDKETGEMKLIGTSYKGASQEFQQVDKLWFNDDVPNYKEHKLFYELNRFWWNKEKNFSASSTEIVWGGYCGSSEQNEDLLNQMIELAKQEEKYHHLFYDKKTLRCVDNTDYVNCLTLGKEYEVEIEYVSLFDSMKKVTDDNGECLQTMVDRFKY